MFASRLFRCRSTVRFLLVHTLWMNARCETARLGLGRELAGLCDGLEAAPIARQYCLQLRRFLPSSDRHIHEARINLDDVSASPDFVGGQDQGPRSTEVIQDAIAPGGAVQQGVRHQGDGLDCWMHGKLFKPPMPKSVYARVVPDVGAIAAMSAELDVIAMSSSAYPEHRDQLVLRSIIRSLPGIRFFPHHKIQHLVIDLAAGLNQVGDVAPIDTSEMNGAVGRDAGCIAKRHREKFAELSRTHFSGSNRKVAMPDAPTPAD